MGMKPKKRTVDAAWVAKLRRTGDDDGWDSDFARGRRLENRMANDMWFEEEMGGGYYSPGPMGDMADYFWQQAERKKRANRRMGRR
jgi:hypothetical protein